MSKIGVSLKINVSMIEKARLFAGQKGKYLDAIEAIGKEGALLEYEKRNVVAERGGFVDDAEVKNLWKQRLPLMQEINEYQMRKSKYLSSQKGSKINFYRGLFHIFGIICAVISFFWGAIRISS